MSRPRSSPVRAGAALVLALLLWTGLALLAAPAHAHPLGDFTVNTHLGLRVEPDAVALDVVVDVAAGLVTVTCTATVIGRTGVEMEAMVGASIGAMTVYDMVKGLERGVVVERVELDVWEPACRRECRRDRALAATGRPDHHEALRRLPGHHPSM